MCLPSKIRAMKPVSAAGKNDSEQRRTFCTLRDPKVYHLPILNDPGK